MILALLGCPGESGDDTAVEAAPYGVLADRIEGGALLSAWSDGDVVRIVGGELSGGAGVMLRYEDGEVCREHEFPAPLWWIHGAAPGEWYAVGGEGYVVHAVGDELTEEPIPTTATLYGVWQTETDVWVVGGDSAANTGEIWHRVEGEWTLHSALPQTIFKVWDDWFVGVGYAARMEEGTLVEHIPDGAPRLLTVRGTAEDDVWAVGGATSPDVRHWDGQAWTTPEFDPYCVSRTLNGVWTAPGAGVWFAGMFGSIGGQQADGTWLCPELPPSQEHFHAAWGHEDEVLFVGGNLFATEGNYGTIVRTPAPAAPVEVGDCG